MIMQLIDENIWKLFLEYSNYISSNGVESGLDVYGTEQRTSLAASLTIAHFLNDISTELKNSNKQNASFQRANNYTVRP